MRSEIKAKDPVSKIFEIKAPGEGIKREKRTITTAA